METFDAYLDLVGSIFNASRDELVLWTKGASTYYNIKSLIAKEKIDPATVGRLLEESKLFSAMVDRRGKVIDEKVVLDPDLDLFLITERFWELVFSAMKPVNPLGEGIRLDHLRNGDVYDLDYLDKLRRALDDVCVGYTFCHADWRLDRVASDVGILFYDVVDMAKLLKRRGESDRQREAIKKCFRRFEYLVDLSLDFIEDSTERTLERFALIYLESSYLHQDLRVALYMDSESRDCGKKGSVVGE